MSRHLVLVLALISVVVALPLLASAAGLGGRGLVGGWTQIQDTKDPHVVEIGKFAVSEYDKNSGGSLRFVKVVKGEKQVVNGINYRLVVAAAGAGSSTKHYEAVVWEKAGPHVIKLQSFKPLSH